MSDDFGVQRKQIYIEFMRMSNILLKRQGIAEAVNDKSLQLWKSQDWGQRLQYLDQMKQEINCPDRNQRKIFEFMGLKNNNQTSINQIDLLKEQSKQNAPEFKFSIGNPNLKKEQKIKREHVEDVFHSFVQPLQPSLSIKKPELGGKNQNKEYIAFYKDRFREMRKLEPHRSTNEITQVVKELWKDQKRFKKMHSNTISRTSVIQMPTTSTFKTQLSQKSVQNKEPTALQNPINIQLKKEMKSDALKVELKEANFLLQIAPNQVIRLSGERLLKSLQEQNTNEIYIDLQTDDESEINSANDLNYIFSTDSQEISVPNESESQVYSIFDEELGHKKVCVKQENELDEKAQLKQHFDKLWDEFGYSDNVSDNIPNESSDQDSLDDESADNDGKNPLRNILQLKFQ